MIVSATSSPMARRFIAMAERTMRAHRRDPAAAHGGTVERAVVAMWRDRLLGVGANSVITRLASVRAR